MISLKWRHEKVRVHFKIFFSLLRILSFWILLPVLYTERPDIWSSMKISLRCYFFPPKLFPDVSGGDGEGEYSIVPIKHYFNFYSPTPFFFLSLLKKIEGGKKLKKLFTTRTNFATLSKEKVFTDNFNSCECYIGLSFSRIITEE